MFSIVRSAGVAAACMLLAAGSAQAQSVTDYNAFIFGDFTGYNTDVEGRLAAGGNVSLTNYHVASALGASADGYDTLIAGGTLSTTNFQLDRGNAVAGTLNLGAGTTIQHGTARTGTSYFDFAAEKSRLLAVSGDLAEEATNGNILWNGGYTLTGTESGLNVFNISGANLSSASGFRIVAPTDSLVLINVDGAANIFQNMGTWLDGGITAGNVLFNFSDATSLHIGGIGIFGSILAPKANVNFSNGQLNGMLIAASMFGGGEFHNVLYKGDLLDPAPIGVPEPAGWAMMIGGMGMIGGLLRRKRRTRAFA